VTAAGTIPFVAIGPATPYGWLIAGGAVRGAGIGLCMIPAMAAVYRAIPAAKVSDGTTQVNVLNRLGGSTGTAVFTVVLQHALAGGGTPAGSAAAFGVAFGWALGAALLVAAPAVLLARVEARLARAALAGPATAVTSATPAVPGDAGAGPAGPAAPARAPDRESAGRG
jgi:hypothetical protein